MILIMKGKTVLRTFFLFCQGAIVVAVGTTVNLTVTPAGIQPGLTPDLTLTCGVSDVITAGSGGIVGRREVQDASQVSTGTQKRADQLTAVTSLVVNKDGVAVASVTSVTAAHASQSEPGLTVSGGLVGGLAGNLSLAWTDPTSSEAGNYSCEVNGLDRDGHSVRVTAAVVVWEREVGVQDLVVHIQRLTNQLKDQQTINQDQQKTIQDQLQCCQQTKTELTSQITALQTSSQQRSDQLLARLTHIETGALDFGSDRDWPPVGNDQTFKTFSVTFAKPYPKPPVVHLSVLHIYFREDFYVWYNLELVSVTSQGFTCGVRGAEQKHFLIYDFHVQWTSFPQ